MCNARCGWLGMGGPGRTLGLLWEVQALLSGSGYRDRTFPCPRSRPRALMLRPLGTKGSCLGMSQKVFEAGVAWTKAKAWVLPITPCSDFVPRSLLEEEDERSTHSASWIKVFAVFWDSI